MKLQQRINAFVELGIWLKNLSEDDFKLLSVNAQALNPWFTETNVKLAFDGMISYLDKENLEKWISTYPLEDIESKNIGVVMAGNIPLVGFHDYLSVLISGHSLTAKLSSNDNYLLKSIHKQLVTIEPFFANKVSFVERLENVDAYIATGSDNSARYFEHYFSKKPNIIRKNRTSIAVLTGNESSEELANLSKDIFYYFGLGCRNVTYLLVPEEYKWDNLYESCEHWKDIIHHTKYCNNYEYSRSVLLVKQVPFFDNGFLIIKEAPELNSAISVLNFKKYANQEEINSFLDEQKDNIQCVVGKGHLPFGSAQDPEVWNYADGVDTIHFLTSLNS